MVQKINLNSQIIYLLLKQPTAAYTVYVTIAFLIIIYFLEKYNKMCSEAMCDSALYNIKLLEKYDFNNIVISLKSSDVIMMIEAYRRMSEICNYPLHIGVTEAGTEKMGVIKSSIGIGSLLVDGIGDTIRVSLTEDPEISKYVQK